MNSSSLPTTNPLLDSCLHLAAGMSSENKLDLIARLSALLKVEMAAGRNQDDFRQAFGAFESTQTAEELIEELRRSRTFTRQLESF